VGRPGEPGRAVRHPVDAAAWGSWPHKGTLVRFSVGLEEPAALQADLEQALRALA
jgi:cystathionine beta-lyase/cystathionine gamma-synthase